MHDDGAELRSVRVQADYSLVLANNRTTLTTALVDCVGISRYGDGSNRYLVARGQRGPDASGTIVMREYSMGGVALTSALPVPADVKAQFIHRDVSASLGHDHVVLLHPRGRHELAHVRAFREMVVKGLRADTPRTVAL